MYPYNKVVPRNCALGIKESINITIEVDEIDEKRLILAGMNISFEEMNTDEENLDFNYLGEKLISEMDLSAFNLDTLKSLNLFNSKSGYNNAAKLLADANNFPGLDIVVFGNSINIFRKRLTLAGESILKQYYDVLELFVNEYIVEKVENGIIEKSGKARATLYMKK